MGLVRLLLALAVLLSHLPPARVHFISGAVAVQAFFIVSGFYMSLVLREKYGTQTWGEARRFWSNRLLRLAPAYFAMMVIAGVPLALFGLTVTSSRDIFASVLSNPGSAVVLILENLAVIGQHWLYWFAIAPDGGLSFDPNGGLPTETTSVAWQALVVPQSWSLSIELIFYACVPWLARRSTSLLVGLALASILLRVWGHWLPVDYGLWQGRLFSTALFLFLFGMLAQRMLGRVEALPRAARLAVFALLVALILFLPQTHWPGELQRWIVYGGVAIGIAFAFSLTRESALDRWIGDLSYPIYLTHLFVIAIVLVHDLPWPSWTALGLTLALSILIMMLIERPVDRWRQRRAPMSGNRQVFDERTAAP